jgi:hypothetical protein
VVFFHSGLISASGSRLHMTERVSVEHLLKKVEPEYPPEAKATRLEGDVISRIIIGKNGNSPTAREAHLDRSSSESPVGMAI